MPYLRKREETDGEPLEGNDQYEGYVSDLAEEVAKRVGIDYVIRPVKDGKYGAKLDNGSWNGMIGELMNSVSTIVAVLDLEPSYLGHYKLENCPRLRRPETISYYLSY